MEVINNGGMKMHISYDKFFEKLKIENIPQNVFLRETKLSGSTLQKIRKRENITTDTICKICDYFHCMPDDIMEWVPDTNASEQQKKELEAEKAEYEKKINEIQKKIDCLS